MLNIILFSETNLKIKQASSHTSSLTSPHLVQNLAGQLRCEQPNNSLYTFEGTLDLQSSTGVHKVGFYRVSYCHFPSLDCGMAMVSR